MTWAKLSDTFNDHPVLLGLPRGVRLLHVEAIVWACKQETDGEIPAGAVARFTDEPHPEQGVELLVDSGMWEPTASGYRIVGFLTEQRSKQEIDASREMAARRQERLRRHRAGDHQLCSVKYCRNAVTYGVGNGVGNAPPTRPDPSSSEGTGRGSDPAPLGSPGQPLPRTTIRVAQ